MTAPKCARYLSPACIIVQMRAKDKDGAIRELAAKLGEEGLIDDEEQVLRDVFAREAQMSTGLKGGLAIPHAKSSGATGMAVALGIARGGIDFKSLDGEPARVIFMVVSGAQRTGPHLEFLAEIARFWPVPGNRDRVLAAKTPQDILAVLGPG